MPIQSKQQPPYYQTGETIKILSLNFTNATGSTYQIITNSLNETPVIVNAGTGYVTITFQQITDMNKMLILCQGPGGRITSGPESTTSIGVYCAASDGSALNGFANSSIKIELLN